jgi:hypothetical protein
MRCRVLHFTGTCYISYIYPRGLRAPGPARKVERLAGLIIWSLDTFREHPIFSAGRKPGALITNRHLLLAAKIVGQEDVALG